MKILSGKKQQNLLAAEDYYKRIDGYCKFKPAQESWLDFLYWKPMSTSSMALLRTSLGSNSKDPVSILHDNNKCTYTEDVSFAVI